MTKKLHLFSFLFLGITDDIVGHMVLRSPQDQGYPFLVKLHLLKICIAVETLPIQVKKDNFNPNLDVTLTTTQNLTPNLG